MLQLSAPLSAFWRYLEILAHIIPNLICEPLLPSSWFRYKTRSGTFCEMYRFKNKLVLTTLMVLYFSLMWGVAWCLAARTCMRRLLQTALSRCSWNTNIKQTAARACNGGDSTCNSLVSIAVGWTDVYGSVNSKRLVYFKWHGTLIQEREREIK